MELKLLLATQSGSVENLYSLIHEHPDILHNFDVPRFIHTPLHEASSTGKIDLAIELMILKPSFAKKLNEDGFSPLHLAVEKDQVDLALELVKFDPSLVRIRGRGGMTPFHLVAKKGDVELFTEFLLACPECVRDANVNGETALHITVMNDHYDALKVLRGRLQRMRKRDASSIEDDVLNRRDRQGNTALHLAASKNCYRAVKRLLKCMSLNRNIQNKSGKTALDVLRDNGTDMNKKIEEMIQKSGGKSRDSLSKVQKMSVFLRKPVTFWEYCSTGMARFRSRMSDGSRNALLVITALIITATYQTAAQPQEKDKDFDLTWDNFIKKILLEILLIWGFNTTAFFSAIALTFILLPLGRAYTWWYIFIMVPLICSYGLFIYMKYAETDLHLLILFMYLVIILGALVYLLVFYVRWKRTTQKKVTKPKSELISQDFKTMV